MSHVHAFFMHMYHSFLSLWYCCWLVLFCVSLSLSFYRILCAWHPSTSLLRPETLFVSGHLLLLILLLLMSGSMMIKPIRTFQRTFLDVAFIRNAKSSFWISPILTYPLSLIVGVRNFFVISRSAVPLWSYKSFTPICMDLVTPYLAFSLLFKVSV